MGSVEQWASDQLHDILGYSDGSVAAYCVSLGASLAIDTLSVPGVGSRHNEIPLTTTLGR